MAATLRTIAFAIALGAGAGARAAPADLPPLVCYGNEPTWRLDIAGDEARLASSGEEEKDYTGHLTSLDRMKVHAWRGRLAQGAGGEIVTILSEDACSDGVSDQRRPYTVRVSLPDGRLLVGCCRAATIRNAPAPSRSAEASPVAPPPAAPAPVAAVSDWAASLAAFIPALRICTFEAMRTEAVLFAQKKPDNSVRLVLRLPGKVHADCEVAPSGTAKLNRLPKDKPLLPEEQAALLTLFPGAPPREPCYRNEPAVDSEGNPFGWISRKGC